MPISHEAGIPYITHRVAHFEPQSCRALTGFNYALVVSVLFSGTAFSSLRVWAISGKRMLPLVVVLVPSLVVPIVNIYGFTLPGEEFVYPQLGCVFIPTKVAPPANLCYCFRLPIASRCAAILTDILVICITWQNTSSLRITAQKAATKITLTTLLIRDGTIYFFFLLVLNIVSLVFDTIPSSRVLNFGGSVITNLVAAVSSILISRFILDLRGIYASGNQESDKAMSSVKFAARITGNLGAPLEDASTWDTNAADNTTESVILSDRPFAEGLLSQSVNETESDGLPTPLQADLEISQES
ncbi:hypothetical protein NLI96_g10968 [Meripilus lineatus]|uniref:Uncharacterized protein n=1 Tax=Meripilus lineatus TaxID=2056292 RepID=A0AAD5YDQ6_9APHY|nr:hypothetical protein NLI96_g10968 [Physisporinus lineatus]